jgi:xanthine dehydrogenase accessory factor
MRADVYRELTRALGEERLVAVATVVAGPGTGDQVLMAPSGPLAGGLTSEPLAAAVAGAAAEAMAAQRSERRRFEQPGGAVEVFFEVHPPRPQLVIVGAVHAAIPLITFAATLGFRTLVVDPRTAFATPERFAHADRLITEWPERAFAVLALNEATYVVLLSHDLKLDLPALRVALRAPVRYIGALGSKKTHAKRVAALREEGFTDAEIARIHAPIGLPLGGRRPEEIAVSIIAEMVAVSHGAEIAAGSA